MKKWLFVVIGALIIALGVVVHQESQMVKKWKDAVANMKAYDNELSAAKEKNSAYKLTISQLNYFQDSILNELNETRKQLKIKDKNLQSLQHVASSFTKIDTVTLRDTLFKDMTLCVDTLLGDDWYKLRLGLRYPSTVSVTPTFKSSKHIIVSSRKETVNPPKKFFLFRWFQRKHTVLNIDVVEKNPYVQDENSKFIEIIK